MRLTNSSLIMTNSLSLNNNNDEILHVIYDYTSKEDDELTLKYRKNIFFKLEMICFRF
jgi:hypothetical protein